MSGAGKGVVRLQANCQITSQITSQLQCMICLLILVRTFKLEMGCCIEWTQMMHIHVHLWVKASPLLMEECVP